LAFKTRQLYQVFNPSPVCPAADFFIRLQTGALRIGRWSENSAVPPIAALDEAKSIEDADSQHHQAPFNSSNRCCVRQKAGYQFK
jgi:hypothetical protein